MLGYNPLTIIFSYFDDWADVFNFNDSCASVIAMYEKEEEEASNNE